MSAFRNSRGVSLVEVMLTLFILALALIPIVSMFSSTHRIGLTFSIGQK